MWRISLFLLIAAGAFATQAAAADETSISCTLGFGGTCSPGVWVPVSVRLQNRTARDISGTVVLLHNQNGFDVHQAVWVPSHSVVSTTAIVCPGNADVDPPGSVATVVWRADDGTELDRTTLPGARITSLTHLPGTLVLTLQSTPSAPSQDDAMREPALAGIIESLGSNHALEQSAGSVDRMPRTAAEYQSYPVVVLDTPPDELDLAQRAALLDHIRQGAALVVPSPGEDFQQSWLADYMPVEIIGTRWGTGLLPAGESRTISFSHSVRITQAVPAQDARAIQQTEIVLRENEAVHAAVRHFGLGRIVFTSFPLAALDAKDGRSRSVWRLLLGMPKASESLPSDSQVSPAEDTRQEMSALLGRPAPTWILAAAVTGAYVLVVIATQIFFRGVRRPLAFLFISLTAITITGLLTAAAEIHHSQDPLTGARLTTLQLALDGQGKVLEQYAFFGRNEPGLQLSANSQQVLAQPIDFDPSDPPMIQVQPFNVRQADAHAQDIRRIWQATESFDSGNTLQFTGTFGPTGFSIQSDNRIGSSVRSPLLVWGNQTLRLKDFPTGAVSISVSPNDLNPVGTYINSSGLIGPIDRLREQRVQAVVLDQDDRISQNSRAQAIGWLDESAINPLLGTTSAGHLEMHAQVLVQAPIRIAPSLVGSAVHIDGPFNRLQSVPGSTPLLIDRFGRFSSNSPGHYLLKVIPPAEIGRLHPAHAVFSIDIDAPQQTVTLQKQQCGKSSDAAKISENTVAPMLTEWNHPAGVEQVGFDINPDDLSADGMLILRLAVQNTDASAIATSAHWAIRSLSASLDGQVLAPPSNPPLENEIIDQPEAASPDGYGPKKHKR